MSTAAEHGADLWPPSFQDISLPAEVQIATQLSRQSTYLKKRPFIHSGADLDKIIERLKKDKKDEFGWGLSFDPLFISRLARHGFLPMAGQCFADLICLLPKLHHKRCIMLDFKEDLKVSRGTMKQSRQYEVTIDQSFDEVISAIQVQHGEDCWFYAPLTKAYRAIHSQNSDIGVYGIRIHSVEVWRSEHVAEDDTGTVLTSKRLVAGEVGYTVGKSYTSLSGFRLSDANGAGTVQCCAVAKLLQRCGFGMWDLGMGMPYKYDLGAQDVSREEFLQHLSVMRDSQKEGESLCILKLDGNMRAIDILKDTWEEKYGGISNGAVTSEAHSNELSICEQQQAKMSKKKEKKLLRKGVTKTQAKQGVHEDTNCHVANSTQGN